MKHVAVRVQPQRRPLADGQAFFERAAPSGVTAESAGTRPADRVWPEVVEVMAEIGIDLSGRRPKQLTREMQERADLAVTMGCGDACPFVPATVEDWDLPDPAGKPIEEVRAVRDTIQARVQTLVDRLAERSPSAGATAPR